MTNCITAAARRGSGRLCSVTIWFEWKWEALMEEGGFIERKETYDEINNNQSSGNSPWPSVGGWRAGRVSEGLRWIKLGFSLLIRICRAQWYWECVCVGRGFNLLRASACFYWSSEKSSRLGRVCFSCVCETQIQTFISPEERKRLQKALCRAQTEKMT